MRYRPTTRPRSSSYLFQTFTRALAEQQQHPRIIIMRLHLGQRRPPPPWLAVLLLLLLPAVVTGQQGLTGFPTNIYDPFCAMACLRSISSLALSCSATDAAGQRVGMVAFSTSSACWASNTPYLTTLAWCMHARCGADDDDGNVPPAASRLELFWETQATGQSSAGVATVPAKWSYAETLARVVARPPAVQLTAEDTELNETSLVPPETYRMQWNVLTGVQREATLENTYGIAMLVTGFGVPVLLTVLQRVPYISRLIRWSKPYLVWPSTIGTYQARPLPYLLGHAPTVGQGLYVALFLALNIVLTSVGYQSRQPNAWYADARREVLAFVLYRTGVFAYIMAPLVFLFGARNNVLLWLSSWSHATFLALHRWVARVFTLQVLLHSVVAVVLYRAEGTYAANAAMPYWIWGVVATLCAVALTFGSGLYVRNLAYEAFLLSHIVLSVVLVVGCWYHYYDLYRFLGGVLDWIYAVVAVWFLDRLVRLARVVAAGPRRAGVVDVGESYVRIDLPGLRWGAGVGEHVYVYFPTLHPLRPWENHPFSVLPTTLLHRHTSPPHLGSASPMTRPNSSSEKQLSVPSAQETSMQGGRRPTTGISLYVRKSAGVTRSLRAHSRLLAFVEGPYRNSSMRDVLRCDRVLLIGGGIGITALLPFAANHWNVKLAWSLRETARCLAEDMEGALCRFGDRDVRVGERFDVRQLLKSEMDDGWERIGVVVSGPGGLCDDVRSAVVAAAKLGRAEFELEVESYSW
ncbi:ferric reductase like transmembrane component-domain-containing protein [Xylariaceae sp. FL0804]|nr:ferric reductase like transmembrane component-domain-containing protein [Xylariaceae sp. FL0804]